MTPNDPISPLLTDKPATPDRPRPGLRLYGLSGALALVLLTFALYNIAPLPMPRFGMALPVLNGLLVLAALSLLVILVLHVHHSLLQPLRAVSNWAHSTRQGQLSTRVPPSVDDGCKGLAQDINALGENLQSLSRDMESQVRKHTDRIQQKTRSLEVLYDVAASINASRDLDDLLERFLQTLREVVSAHAATIRLVTTDNKLRLVASSGLSRDTQQQETSLPVDSSLCGKAAASGQIVYEEHVPDCNDIIGSPHCDVESLGMIAVPLQYRGQILGVYSLYVDQQHLVAREDIKELLTSIGRHLGMAIEKARVDEEANRLSIMEERNRLAHELHDSLAQSLASLRFQVRVLDETLHQGNESALWQELERIENSLDEAYTELRELIAHFRAPMDGRGLFSAIEKQIERFRNETDIHIFLQKEWGQQQLPADVEMQVLRIVQESLVNIRKHSNAQNVRVLLSGKPNGSYRVLVEDDGDGMSGEVRGAPGEHVGLSIMEERARRIGGDLRIESEPGEGTQVQLSFTYHADLSGKPNDQRAAL